MSYDHLIEMETWVFDLDNTLYPVELNLFDQIDKRMCGFIAEYLKINHAEAYKVQKSFFREHGTSLKGMMDVHNMDPGPYLDYVHDIDFDAVAPDARLDAALSVLKGRKVVFTNAATKYAERVLDRLGISHHFDGVFDIVDADYRPKPDPAVYSKVVEVFDFDPANAIMVEDIARNLKPAAELGMKTVWVMTDRPWAHTDSETANPDYRTNSLSAWLAEVTGI